MKQTLLFSILLLSFFSCQKKVETIANGETISIQRNTDISIFREEPGGGDCVTPLNAELVTFPDAEGASVGKGELMISNDDNFLYVTVNTIDAATRIGSVKLLYGSETFMKQASNYSADASTGFTSPQLGETLQTTEHVYTFQVPLSSVNATCVSLSVHATFHELDASGAEVAYPVWTNPFASSSVGAAYPWSGYVEYCTQFCVKPTCGQLRTQSPGGWGTSPAGSNPGVYLQANFASAFPSGLTVGCDPDFNLVFTSATAIRNFLPSGGKAQALNNSYVNPTGIKNVLAGHLVTLTLSVGFDNYDAAFGEAGMKLGDMIIKGGVFEGWSVSDFLTEGNMVLGGCSKQYTAQQVLLTASMINENYLDGKNDRGFLVCPQ